MKITHQQELQPFQTPNYVLPVMPVGKREDGPRLDGPKYALHELSDEVLEELCARFRHDVLAKARAGRDSQSR